MIAIDTNLLIYAHRAGVPEHRAARRAIEEASRDRQGWGLTLQSVAEFWSIVTHPASSGGASTLERGHAFLRALSAAGAEVWSPGGEFWVRLLRLAEELRIRGPRIFDLQIALTAIDNGALELWTHDRDFVVCPGLRVRDPI